MRKGLYFPGSFVTILSFFAPEPVVLAQDQDKPAIAPLPRTINLTQEQRFIIKENVKDLQLPKAPSNAPETIGDIVPQTVELHSLPPQAAQRRCHKHDHICFSSRRAITPSFSLAPAIAASQM